MKLGYARVSKQEQNLDLQKDALTKAGCERIFEDKASGAKIDRAGLEEALHFLREGDTLVVWKLDRLGRSLKQLVETVTTLNEKGINFSSLTESLDTTAPTGKLIFHIFSALAEFERDIIRQRTRAGLDAARSRGKIGGRPAFSDYKKVKLAKTLHADKDNSIQYICETMGISKMTLYRYLKKDIVAMPQQ